MPSPSLVHSPLHSYFCFRHFHFSAFLCFDIFTFDQSSDYRRLELQVSEDFKSTHTMNKLILIFLETFLNASFLLIYFQNILIYMITVTLKFQETLKGLESVSSLS